MANPYPIEIADAGDGSVKVAGKATFTDPSNQPGGGSQPSYASMALSGTPLTTGAFIPLNVVRADADGYWDGVNNQFVVPAGKGGAFLVGGSAGITTFTDPHATVGDLTLFVSTADPNVTTGMAATVSAHTFDGALSALYLLPDGASVGLAAEGDVEVALVGASCLFWLTRLGDLPA